MPAHAATGWSPTSTKATVLSGATILAPIDDATSMHIVIGLAMRDRAGAYSLLISQATPGNPAYRQFLTPDEFTANYSATDSAATVVQQYLLGQGFTNVTLASNRLFIEATGTAAVVQKAFNTSLTQFQFNGQPVFANTSDAQVPDTLSGIVTGVVGLQNAFAMHTFLGQSAAGKTTSLKPGSNATQLPPVTLTASEFQTFYDAAGVPEATNTTVAIFTAGDMTQDLLDIAQYRNEQKLDPVPVIVKNTGLPSTDTSGDGEWDMDIATSTGLAGNVKQLILYAATSLNDADLIPNFNHFVTDNIATVGNASFGGCTLTEMTAGGLDVYDPIFEAAAAQGQTVFASAGDVGSSCPVVGVANGVPGAGLPDQSYPASSPYVMGVGGTTLTVNDDYSYGMEISWDAGGGGMEPLEYSPFWQQPVLPTGAVNGAASPIGGLPVSARGVPDVAMDADFLLSPAAYVLDGADTSNGGTSLASPLMTGCYARMQSRDNNQLGHAGPLFYTVFATAGVPTATINAMHDIIVGANGANTALPGYDYTTGIGTCDIAAMAKLLPVSTGGTTTGGTTGGATSGGTTGGTSGGTTGGTSGGTTTGGSTSGGTTGGTTSGGGSSGGTTGGTSGGTTTGGTTGGTTTGGTTSGGTTTGGTSTGVATGGTTGSASSDGRNHGGAFGWEILLALSSLAGFRRRQSRLMKR